MPGYIDLHIHTNYSDGVDSPAEILKIVRRKGLAAIAICDHDNLQGYLEAKGLLEEGDPELVPAVELSAGGKDDDIHILGYGFDPESSYINEALAEMRRKRNRRGRKMLLKLKEMGFDIPYDVVREIAGKSAIARPHVADALLKLGFIKRYETAFGKYIGHDGPAYVAKENITPKGAIDLIHRAGGLAILAHPGIGGADKYIEDFIELGLDGIEVYHPQHNRRLRDRYTEIAAKNHIIATGGSDYHGRSGRNSIIGAQRVPYELLMVMKEKLKSKTRGIS
ncbi:PHP protein [Candidatus Zixiibacteriota bacterium]|nr:PHP protein [candidate division Zixibacteria bacterium]